jgi:DNA-binding transcriptional ArsR family regulator
VAPEASSTYREGAELLKALAHPGRLQILHELADGDRCVHELVELLGLPQPTISQHLKTLRGARLVNSTRVGRENRYTLADQHVTDIVAGVIDHAREHEYS